MNTSNNCSDSVCGCDPGLARRDFLKLAGIVAAGAALPNLSAIAGPFDAADFAYSLIPADKKLSTAWLRSLTERGEPTIYRGAELDNIGMPVGGVCAGQLYPGGDGRLWHWDIFNAPDPGLIQLTGGPHYAKPMKPKSPLEQGFALKVNGQVRRLDKTGFPDVTFCGQYPIGTVNYRDAACPVAVKLEAYSPFIPLNAEDSGLPTTVMEFAVKNDSSAAVEVELAGWLENAVCKFSAGAVGVRRNRVARDGGMVRVESSAAGDDPGSMEKRTDIVFADFEDGTYGAWKTEGTAFGSRPVTLAEIPAYQSPPTMGAHGRHWSTAMPLHPAQTRAHATARPANSSAPSSRSSGTLSVFSSAAARFRKKAACTWSWPARSSARPAGTTTTSCGRMRSRCASSRGRKHGWKSWTKRSQAGATSAWITSCSRTKAARPSRRRTRRISAR